MSITALCNNPGLDLTAAQPDADVLAIVKALVVAVVVIVGTRTARAPFVHVVDFVVVIAVSPDTMSSWPFGGVVDVVVVGPVFVVVVVDEVLGVVDDPIDVQPS